jgi:hypothetical protein
MLKKVFLAAAMSLAVVGATMTAAPTPAEACKSGCFKKAKAKYPDDRKARKVYRKACKAHYKAHKTPGKMRLFRGGLFKKAA